jgi:integrase
MNLASIPFERQDSFELVAEALQHPTVRASDFPLHGKADTYLCEFLASAIHDGALLYDFHRTAMSIRFSDISLSPFTGRMPVSAEDTDSSPENNIAFFRYWFSPLTEIYFLRLMIFLLKYHKELDFQFEGDYVFPANWRSEEKLTDIAGLFDRWSSLVIKDADAKTGPLGIRAFRLLSISNVIPKVPCFTTSALRGQLSCDSLHERYLAALDTVLTNARNYDVSYSVVEETGKEAMILKDEAERIFEENKKFLLSNEQFSATMEKLKEVVDSLPAKLYRKDRLKAAKEIEDTISGLPREGSDTPQRFLFNVLIFGKWLSYLIRETKYDAGTIKTRSDTIRGKFIYMLGNNAIHELTSDQLVDIIIRTYTAYDSKSISTVIKAFTEDLYDYQEAIFPEMTWESLPWGKGDVLYKGNTRKSKPLVTFQMVRDALERISRAYSGKKAKRLRVALILGFCAGLRIVEVAHLGVGSVMLDGGYTLAIRESKTRSGTRNIRLALLLHEDELKEVVDFFTAEERLENRRGKKWDLEKSLFSDIGAEHARKTIPLEIARIFKQLEHTVRFHHLRHSFANWFLVRALAVVRGVEIFPEDSPFLKEKLFTERFLSYVGYLLLGYGRRKKGRLSFAYIMPALAKIMGHYGPETTLTSYVHIVDWIYYLYIRKAWDQMTLDLDSPTVRDFMQLSYQPLPASLGKKGLKGISPSTIISEQHKVLVELLAKMDAGRVFDKVK